MNKVYILLGGNEGDPAKNLRTAKKKLEKAVGSIHRESSVYQTAAWGMLEQPDFLNQVIIIETALSPRETLAACLGIESAMGRVRTVKNAPRIIDIDILFFGKLVLKDFALTVPHAEIPNRRFVLVPLNELSPNMKHPVLNKTIHQLLTICPDKLDVKKI
ncbi:2-amino-4-hydroxy-6-hydroxymethyldihydropteridine diphosphokinase [Ferruginibacter sp. HRS2-29]|uniref:2-amino-4-hydroxy-6- hydroxymethyldihydropteridine diphosphokinase n=1 Tax=Ferruginibacter sp. HRS2-29 TaxID=2487334 RepID=UPI0020CE3047|nr:2-amino-4-hydroxy-6-hydroxymethyldihydropteridine diphosphokinase [Ferruginibacter sp. HRS2-29]MCP9752271.1 2-amino-4-hydroxy-6-hydroxymethyldihydropteridine diphosphokinase [Ferruginibacter sp. HRS2-29]